MSDVDHLHMLYPEFVDRAMRSQTPVTRIKTVGEYRRLYEAAQYDPETEIVWRAYIDVDQHPGYATDPSVDFSKCHPTASEDWAQAWISLATGRLTGPQTLGSWESLFAVFNAALGVYNREGRQDTRTDITNTDQEDSD